MPASRYLPTIRGHFVTIPSSKAITPSLLAMVDEVAYHIPAFGVNKVKGPKPPIEIGDHCTTFAKTIHDYLECSPCVEFKGTSTSPMVFIQFFPASLADAFVFVMAKV